MKTASTAPILIVGQFGDYAFQAEVYGKDRIIICSSGDSERVLENPNTESRARFVVRELLKRHWRFVHFPAWLYVEVQTCWGDVRVKKITGLKYTGNGESTRYEDLSSDEAERVLPLLRQGAGIQTTQKERTPSPNASR
jgi:hypothetical protein